MSGPKKVMRAVEYTRSDIVEHLRNTAELAHSTLMNLLTGTADVENVSDYAAVYSVAAMLRAAIDNLSDILSPDGEK